MKTTPTINETCQPANSVFTKTLASKIQVVKAETWLSKAVDNLTSLPVCLVLLAVLCTHGASLTQCWFLTYPLLALIASLGCLYVISLISTPTAHDMTEKVCLTFLSVISALTSFDMTDDIARVETDKAYHAAISSFASTTGTNKDFDKKEESYFSNMVPTWLQLCLVLSIALRPDLSCEAATGFVAVFLGHRFALYMSAGVKGATDSSYTARRARIVQLPEDELRDLIFRAALPSLTLSVLAQYVCGASSLLSGVLALYSLTVDSRALRALRIMAECSSYADAAEGREKFYCSMLTLLSQPTLTLLIALTAPSDYAFSAPIPVLFAAAVCCVYTPIDQVRFEVAPAARRDAKTLRHISLATATEISSYADVCAVCLGDMRCARVTPCGHLFHGKCLKDCMAKRPDCPLCNQAILIES